MAVKCFQQMDSRQHVVNNKDVIVLVPKIAKHVSKLAASKLVTLRCERSSCVCRPEI